MAAESKVTQWMVDQLVKPEYQYLDAIDPPLDSIRMAWPFKTDAELNEIKKWFKSQKIAKTKTEHDEMEEALL
jgi:hypothetical protein